MLLGQFQHKFVHLNCMCTCTTKATAKVLEEGVKKLDVVLICPSRGGVKERVCFIIYILWI